MSTETELDVNDELMDDDDMDDTFIGGLEELAEEEAEQDEPEQDATEEEPAKPEPDKIEEKHHKPPASNTVPQARFNEERIKSKQKDQTIAELQRELDNLKQAKAEQEAVPAKKQSEEMKELRKQYKDAIFEDDDSHYEIQEKIDALIRQEAEELFERKMAEREANLLRKQQEEAIKSDQDMINASLADWITEYPELDQDAEEFDVELWTDAMTYQAALVTNQNMTGHAALQKAFKRFVGKAPGETPAPKSEKAPVIDERTKRSVTRGVEQSKKAAPNINQDSTGNRNKPSLEIDWDNMTEAEFDKLPQHIIDAAKGKKKR